ncbi:MAG: CHAT domain-containing protein [Deltaproteobacteria bacterium]|nr:CHAT domain-containing protein [Deltaproteobacteria bacterium]
MHGSRGLWTLTLWIVLCAAGAVQAAQTAAEVAAVAQADYDARRFEEALAGWDKAVELARAEKNAEQLDKLLFKQRISSGVLATERLDAKRGQEALPLYQKALAISRERGDKPGEIFDLSSVGYCLRAMNKPKDAVQSYEAARKLAGSLGLVQEETQALDQLVQTAVTFENLPLAADYLQQAIDFNLAHGDAERVVRAGLWLLPLWAENRPFWEIAPVLQKVIGAVKERKDEAATHEIVFAYLEFLQTAGLEAEVGTFLQKRMTEQAFAGLSNAGTLKARRLAMLAHGADARGEFVTAEAVHRDALAQFKAADDAAGVMRETIHLAEHFRLAGQYGQALQQCEAAIALAKDDGSWLAQGKAALCKARVLAALGKHADADTASGEAAKFGKAVGSKSLMAQSLSAAAAGWRVSTEPGLVLQGAEREKFKGEQSATLQATGHALEMFGAFSDALNLGREAVLAAPAFLALGELQSASQMAEMAIDSGQKLNDPQLEGSGLRMQAEVALASNKPDEVRRLSAQALAIAEEIGDGENAARTWDVLARVEARAGRIASAILLRKQAVNAVQALRGSTLSLSRDLRAAQTHANEALYRDLAADLLREGRLAEAEQVMAMLKEEEFRAFIRNRGGDARTVRVDAIATEAPWMQRYDALKEKMSRLGQDLRAVRPSTMIPPEMIATIFAGQLPPDAAQRAAALEPQLAAARKEFVEYLGALSQATDALAAAPKQARQGFLQGKLAALGEGAVALYYVLQSDRVQILLATPSGFVHRESMIPQDTLARLVNAFRAQLTRPERDPRPTGRKLYDLLVAPVEKELAAAKARTVMLALDGGLRYVPFAALYDGQQYLVQRYAFAVYTPAAGASVDRAPRKEWTVAALGVSEAELGFDSLPGVPAELSDIVKKKGGKGVLPGTMLLDAAFTRAALSQALRAKPAVVHIASHFAFDPDGTDADSFLLLGGKQTLTLSDFAAGEFPLEQLDLLTLSACQTGVGSTGRDGVEVEGFGVLAQRKGAAAVMATLWPVADLTTSLFMREFYRRHETEHLSKARALRAIQLGFLDGTYGTAALPAGTRGLKKKAAGEELDAPMYVEDVKTPFAHPTYWAPFLIMGNGL